MHVPLVSYHVAGPSDVTHSCGNGSVHAQLPLSCQVSHARYVRHIFSHPAQDFLQACGSPHRKRVRMPLGEILHQWGWELSFWHILLAYLFTERAVTSAKHTYVDFSSFPVLFSSFSHYCFLQSPPPDTICTHGPVLGSDEHILRHTESVSEVGPRQLH